MGRPLLLDLFCCAGGAAMGYHRAGFDVIGVDHRPQARYPFDFVQADALDYLEKSGRVYDAIHASPPCQDYSAMNRAVQVEHPRMIAAVRAALELVGRPYVIENVEGAWREMRHAVTLCGTMFGLRVRRHRLFEVSPRVLGMLPECTCHHGVIDGRLIGHRVAGKVAPGRTKPPHATESQRREAMGCEWMTTMEARQAIPPAYTEWVGKQLMHHVETLECAA